MNGSIMKGLEHQIYMAVLMKEHMSMSEIQHECLNSPPRTVYRAVKELVENRILEHKRVIGKGKRKRYFVKEEKIKTDMTMRAFKEGVLKNEKLKKELTEEQFLAFETRSKVTQRNLSQLITQDKHMYRQGMEHMEQFGETNEFYFYHIGKISDILEWITKLTMAIESGMLGDSPHKLALARRNKERYERFLKELCNNIKQYNKTTGKKVITAIYAELTDSWFMKRLIESI